MVAPFAAALGCYVTKLVVLDNDFSCINTAKISWPTLAAVAAPPFNIELLCVDVFIYRPDRKFESIFYDPYPARGTADAPLAVINQWVKHGCRLVMIADVHDEEKLQKGWERELEIPVDPRIEKGRIRSWLWRG